MSCKCKDDTWAQLFVTQIPQEAPNFFLFNLSF